MSAAAKRRREGRQKTRPEWGKWRLWVRRHMIDKAEAR